MGYRIFYSYQSDIPKKLNQNFIRDAINEAIRQISDYKIEKLIEGFYGIGGNTPLAEEMLKQSRKSDIFIGDVTFTSSKVWHNPIDITEDEKSYLIEIPKGNLKPSPNPNVLLETGYSWALKNYERTILVMNTAFGLPENLPVDMGDKRHPITYNLSLERFNKESKQKKEFERLSNAFHDAILTVINSDAEYQRERWAPMQLHKDWYQRDFGSVYRPTNKAKEIINKLRVALEDDNVPQRIVGPKSSGKTRLVYELYRAIDDTLKEHNNIAHLIYYDLKGDRFSDTVRVKFQDLKNSYQRKILVLDNCPISVHEDIYNELPTDGHISLLTIGDNEDGKGASFYLDLDYANETIGKISNEIGNPSKTNFILDSSKGNLSEAIAMIGKIPEDEVGLSEDYQTKWEQIIGKEKYNDKFLSVLEELSLFTHIGFSGRFQQQADILLHNTGVKSREDLEEIISILSEISIIKVTGDFIILEAFIEQLTIKRLERLLTEDLKKYFGLISKLGLSKQFNKRFIESRKLDSISKVIKELSKQNGLFDQYDFVTSDQGAKILMSISEINPEKALEILIKNIGDKTTDELKEIEDGRRNIIWTIERLLFRQETFKGAAILLFNLSVAENEEIGNNATSQFCQLFQVGLPATEVSLEVRLKFIKKLIDNHSNAEKPVLIQALDRALMTRGFIRMGGADKQADETFVDYTPKTLKEIKEYYEGIINLLEKLEAFEVLVNKFNAQITEGNRLAILDAIERVSDKQGEINKDLRQQFEYIINDPRGVTDDVVKRIENILEKHSNHNTREKLEFKVALAPYAMYKSDKGEYINKSEEKAKLLATELIDSESDDWLSEIDILLQDKQHLTFEFGKELATLKPNYQNLIDEIIKKLIKIPFEEQNNILIDGYFSHISDDNFKRAAIDDYLLNKEIAFHAIKMTRFLEIEFTDIKKLFSLISQNPNFVVSIEYLSLEKLNDQEILEFFRWLNTIKPYGFWISISLAERYLSKKEELSSSILQLTRSLLMTEGVLKGENMHVSFAMHQYVELFKKYTLHNFDKELVLFLSQEIVLASKEIHFNHKYHIKDILEMLIDENWEVTWAEIGTEILKQDYFGWYNLKDVLKRITNFEDAKLLAWMDSFPQKAPQKIVNFIKLVVNDGDKDTWSPLAKEMFNRYYNNKDFLNALDSDLHSYFWSGSLVPLLTSRKQLVVQLLDHEHQEIRNFAKRNKEYLEEKIIREQRSDQNEGLDF